MMKQSSRYLISQKNVTIKVPNILIGIFAALVTYSVLPLFVLAEIYIFVFQNICFRICAIPLLKRKNYVQIDRQKLSKLSITQKINCVYCGYANGMSAYLKAVTNQMEIYSCAVKHSHENSATQHQQDFFEYQEFK